MRAFSLFRSIIRYVLSERMPSFGRTSSKAKSLKHNTTHQSISVATATTGSVSLLSTILFCLYLNTEYSL